MVNRLPHLFLFSAACALSVSCGWLFHSDGHLRGSTTESSDGQTYLSILDDNGGGCGPILVDGQAWPHKIGVPGLIAPGIHRIECGGGLELEIPPGVIFHFDYWGP